MSTFRKSVLILEVRRCTGGQVKTYLVPPLGIWIVNIVEGIFINLSEPCLLANCYETIGIPFAVPSVKLKSKPVKYDSLYLSDTEKNQQYLEF